MPRYKLVNDHGTTRKAHRVIWENVFGPIPPGCEIHHVDGNGHNNRLDNLMLLTRAQHRALHARLRKEGVDPVDPDDPDVVYDREKSKSEQRSHKSEISKKNRIYREAHREEIAEKKAQYHIENRDKINARSKAFRESHKEEVSEKKKSWYMLHRDEVIAHVRAYSRLKRAIATHQPIEVIEELRRKSEATKIKKKK